MTSKTIWYSVVMAMDFPDVPGIKDAKAHLTDYVNRVLYAGARVQITKNNKPVAVLVSVTDAALLDAIYARPELLAIVRSAAGL